MDVFQFLAICMLLNCSYTLQSQDAEVVYEFISVDYDWLSPEDRSKALHEGDYIIENNIITGIKLYKDDVFVTVPRWKPGVPSTLNRVLATPNKYPILQPYPSWEMNRVGNCSALQYVQSMEMDPNTGYMWIIDTGRIDTYADTPRNLCPPKLLIWDTIHSYAVHVFEFPDDIVSHTRNFINDIVLDYVNGVVKFAYITELNDAKIIVYDYAKNTVHYFHDSSMVKPAGLPGKANIDGIAMSPDFQFVYYCVLSAPQLYAVKTSVLRNKHSIFDQNVIFIGNKTGGSDGMAFGEHSLFYGVFEENAVYKVSKEFLVNISRQEKVVSDNKRAVWVDTFAWNNTDLWFVANQLSNFFTGAINFTGQEPNLYIWRVSVGQNGYLYNAPWRTFNNHVIGILGRK